jgi:hypothetical protein
MSDNLNIEKSWKTITLIPDFMNEVVNFLDYKETLKDVVRFCEIDNDNDKSLLFYSLYSYTVKAYKAKVDNEFIIENEKRIISYFDELIKYYNELTNYNYNELYKDIWYFSIYRNTVNDTEIDERLEAITFNPLFDDCEIRHKSLMLNIHIQYLLDKDDSDFDKLIILNEKLKELNSLVRRMNGEDK